MLSDEEPDLWSCFRFCSSHQHSAHLVHAPQDTLAIFAFCFNFLIFFLLDNRSAQLEWPTRLASCAAVYFFLP